MVFPDTYTNSETFNLLANNISTTGDVSLAGNLNVGSGASASNVRAYATHSGDTSYLEVKAVSRDTTRLIFFTDFSYGSLQLGTNISNLMRLTYFTNEVIFISHHRILQLTG